MRVLNLSNYNHIDLHNNMITSKGVDMIAAWIVALPACDFDRVDTLVVDLRQNKVIYSFDINIDIIYDSSYILVNVFINIL